VYDVRSTAIQMLVSLSGKASQNTLINQIIPMVEKYKDSKNSKYRVVYLHYIKSVAHLLPSNLLRHHIENATNLTKDLIPNVRYNAIKSILTIFKLLKVFSLKNFCYNLNSFKKTFSLIEKVIQLLSLFYLKKILKRLSLFVLTCSLPNLKRKLK
jgi:hypothetical protein